jgi:tRNA modification GTPase
MIGGRSLRPPDVAAKAMSQPRDTIAAVATPAGAGGIGVVRLSGPDSLAIAERFLGKAPRPRFAHRALFRDAAGEAIDDGLLIAFPAPHSYTGEDVVELQAHGSPQALARLLARCLELGARVARPGEYSERAYLEGKLDLAQAEAVADLIAAGSEAAARAARRSLDGEFSRAVEALAEQMIELRVWVEAAIDFPEEEIDFLASEELAQRFAAARSTLDSLRAAAQRGRVLTDGLHVVILGEPNVGKSSLLNALAGHERAIVTPIAGTTRDTLNERIEVDGLPLTLVDTAGLRETGDVVEREGVARAGREAERADLVLWVVDSSMSDTVLADPLATLPALAGIPRLVVHNKLDLSGGEPRSEGRSDGTHVHLSARTGAGLDQLRQALRAAAGLSEGSEGSFSARQRHLDALARAATHLESARSEALDHGRGELAAEDLRRAHDALGEITGRMQPDELLGEIFGRFCIGK